MAGKTLYDKLWENHVVHQEADGTALHIDRHLIHEVTSPQAFEGLKLAGRKPWRISSMSPLPITTPRPITGIRDSGPDFAPAGGNAGCQYS